MREMKTNFALKLFKEIAAQWIEDRLSTKSRQIESVEVLSRICRRQNKELDGLRICQASIEQTESKEFWLNGSKKLSRFYQEETQKSRWIKKLSRSYQDKFQIAQWIKDAIRSVKKKSPRVSIDSYLSRFVEKLLSLIKIDFSKRGKTQK